MWRVGVCLVALALLTQAQQSGQEHGILVHRLRRYTNSDCGSDYGPPPPPQFRPPPPPLLPPNPPPPRYEEYGKPCDTCGRGQSGAVSNAQSNTGEAIAVAIAKAQN